MWDSTPNSTCCSVSFTGHERRPLAEPVLLWAQDFWTFAIRVILVLSTLSPRPAFYSFVCAHLALQNSKPSLAHIPLPGAGVSDILLFLAPPTALIHAGPPRVLLSFCHLWDLACDSAPSSPQGSWG